MENNDFFNVDPIRNVLLLRPNYHYNKRVYKLKKKNCVYNTTYENTKIKFPDTSYTFK